MKRVFFYHYNKPASRSAGRPKLSIHYKNSCLIVDKVICHPMTETVNRKRQPHCVVKGRCLNIHLEDTKDGLVATIL